MLANAESRLLFTLLTRTMHPYRPYRFPADPESARSNSAGRYQRQTFVRYGSNFVRPSFQPTSSFDNPALHRQYVSNSLSFTAGNINLNISNQLITTHVHGQRRSLSTSTHADSISGAQRHAPSGKLVDPICISSEESDTEASVAKQAKKLVPGLSLVGRQWDEISSGVDASKNPAGSVDFSVMSYNILSQQLLVENGYLYRTCSPSNLKEDFRVGLILEELLHTSPDVVCLQEVEAKLFFETLKPKFSSIGYQCLYKKRTGTKPDGCAILVNSNKFSIVNSREIEFFAPSVDLLDRDNVAIVALLEVKCPTGSSDSKNSRMPQTPARLVVANTHLLFNQRRGDIKLAQLQYLLAEIDRMALFGVDATSAPYRLLVYYPILLCGDLNLEPYSPLYSFITEGFLHFEGMPRALLSGQHTSTSLSVSGAGPIMSRSLLPDSFGLADNSEFAEVCLVKNSMTSCVSASSGGPIVADMEKDVTRQINTAEKSRSRQYYSGTVSHPFLLRPVYEYDTRDKGDFTSLTRGSRHTVDHMFYSVVRNPSDSSFTQAAVHEGRLHLLRRLRVPTSEAITSGYIPGPKPSLPADGVPSDHIPLLAEFRFEVPRATISPLPLTSSL